MRPLFPVRLAAVVAMLMASIPSANATDYYWDTNGDTAGAGATPTGTWDSSLSALWTLDPSGSSATAAITSTGSDNLFFVAGPAAGSGNNAYVVTVDGTQLANSLTFQSSGNATLSGGTINLYSGNVTSPQFAYGSTNNGTHTINSAVSLGDPGVATGTFTATFSNTGSNFLRLGGEISKANAGTTWNLNVDGGGTTEFFGTAATTNPFTATTVDNGSTLRVALSQASGSYSFGDSGSTITLNNGGRFQLGNSLSANPLTVQNNFVIGSGGGRIETYRIGNPNESYIFSGTIDLGGDLSITTSYAGSGSTTYSNTLTVTGGNRAIDISTGGNGSLDTYSGAIEQDAAGRTVTFRIGNTNNSTKTTNFTGNNTIDHMVFEASTLGTTNRARFGNFNAVPETSFKIGEGAFVGIGFSNSSDFATTLSRITSDSTGVLGIDVSTSNDIDLSATGINRNLSIGSSQTVTYSGFITPFGSVYSLGSGGGTITFSAANVFTGDRSVRVSPVGKLTPAATIISNDNDYTGDTTVRVLDVNFRPGTAGAQRLEATVNGADRTPFGTGTLQIERGQVRIAPSSNSATATTISQSITFGEAGYSELTLTKNSNSGSFAAMDRAHAHSREQRRPVYRLAERHAGRRRLESTLPDYRAGVGRHGRPLHHGRPLL